ncbi:PrsW family intramembrane metalloprotease [Cnuibacter physcomitrellae]|uniref:PrsW family intramembrane metalloprotease n=1 Tax=Cnuibacter physcomitrellae TaxID=1619308 RepID=UPI002175878A|nr:PrsW family intramembrane metalloprotease [Cnuibacter physcomitrellae]MCS5496757.1 PrsW family intramembrane metalloprotease [Cnuibacter physcomitrellae]
MTDPARTAAEPIPGGAPALPSLPPVAARRTPSTALIVFTVLGFTIVGFLALAVTAYLFFGLGPVAFVISGVLALIPLAVVITAITLIDRWEPEPRPALLFAFLWGAAASVAAALVVDVGVQIFVELATGGPATTDVLASVIQAPVVEEGAKGLGVLLLFWVFRRQFDGPVDGLVYGATIAAGFAFTENILYFASALADGGIASLGITFGLRGIMAPFAHVMFTACTGVAIGFAARSRNIAAGIGIVIAGWLLAVGLHAFWNGSTYLVEGLGGFFLLYVLVQVPLFAVAIVLVVQLRKAETRATAARLAEYAAAGWYAPDEVCFLSTGAGRRAALRWASTLPGGRRAMRSFIRDSTRLAFTRQRIVTGRGGLAPLADERALLDAVTADRIALASARGVAL